METSRKSEAHQLQYLIHKQFVGHSGADPSDKHFFSLQTH